MMVILFSLLLVSLFEGLQVLKTDAQILRSVNYAHQLIQKFGPVSLHDFRTVIVALLRSFLQVCIGPIGLYVISIVMSLTITWSKM